MANRRKIGTVCLWWLASAPLWGGTGRPSDGFLSFILLLGFLLTILAIMQVVGYVKKWAEELLEDLF